jgi:DNA polymerase-3 subunit delta
MVALKGASIESFADNPPKDANLTIVYGPDSGLVDERAKLIARRLASRHDGDVIRRDAGNTSVSALFEAAQGASLFGGAPVLVINSADNGLVPTLIALRETSPETPVIVQAGDLKPGAALRKLGEGPNAYALPCYRDDARTIATLAREMASEHGLAIDNDAAHLLSELLGGDRRATRNEIEKLCLYAAGDKTIGTEHVLAICGDDATFALGDLADLAGLGNIAALDADLQRARREDTAPQAILAAFRSHFLQLRQARTAIEAGATAEAAMQKLRPRIFFRREKPFRTQLVRWSVAETDQALSFIELADLKSRQDADLAEAVISRLTYNLARLARTPRR